MRKVVHPLLTVALAATLTSAVRSQAQDDHSGGALFVMTILPIKTKSSPSTGPSMAHSNNFADSQPGGGEPVGRPIRWNRRAR